MIEKKMTHRNTFMDFEKGLACILIILIHRRLPGTCGQLVSAIARSGVALFFIISGYYTYNKNELPIIKRRTKKLGLLLALSLTFYFFWESALRFVGSGWQSMLNWWGKDVFSLTTWYYALVWDNDPFAGHLWFIFALIKCYIIFYYLLKFCKEKIKYMPFICGIAIFILRATVDSMNYYRNGWIYGMLFFSLGYVIAENRSIIYKRINKLQIIIGIILGILLTVLGYYLVGTQQIYIGTIIISLCAFLITLYLPETNNSLVRNLALIGQKYSLYIYIFHWAIKEVFIKFDKELPFANDSWYMWITPFILIVMSVIAAVIIGKIIDYVTEKITIRT